MRPFILKEKCSAQPGICPPLKECPQKAVFYVEDENEAIGGRIEIDDSKCDGCGICVDICCGNSIEAR